MSGIIGLSPNMRSGMVGKFPTGHIINAKQWIDTSGSYTVSSATDTSFTDSVDGGQASFTTTTGNTYLVQFQGEFYIASDGSNISGRAGTIYLRYGTSAVAEGATTSLGDVIVIKTLGRDLIAASTVAASSNPQINIMYMFTAGSATTYYFNISGKAGTERDQILSKTSTRPAFFTYYEFQGDITA